MNKELNIEVIRCYCGQVIDIKDIKIEDTVAAIEGVAIDLSKDLDRGYELYVTINNLQKLELPFPMPIAYIVQRLISIKK